VIRGLEITKRSKSQRTASTPIRVALFHPALIHGGIQRVFVNLARGFLAHGLAVDLVQATTQGNFRDQIPAGVRLVDLNASRALTSLFPLVRYLRREHPEVIISGSTETNVVAVWAKHLARVRVRLILTEHGIHSATTLSARSFRTRAMPFFVRRFYPWADDLAAVSQGAAEDLALLLGIPKGDIEVIYNPVVSPEFWRRAAEPLRDNGFAADPRPVILAVGRLHYHKDFPTLLRAMAIVRRSTNARLAILGDGEERDNLVALSRQLELDSVVSFLGNVPNPLPYMRRATVLASSSLVEGLSLVLVEALAIRMPIVATDCPTGPRDILCNGAYGKLVPVGDSAALAKALISVLKRPERPSVPDEALTRFGHDHVIGKYLAMLGVTGGI
jgi:glycosyltransferase involved in cell wall biosynthesis